MISSFIPDRFDGVIGQAANLPEVEFSPISRRTLHTPKAEAGYLKTARRMFLEGTSFTSPVDAVSNGVRTIEEWCDCLRQLRLEYGVHAHHHGDNA
jgi:hypothetical protein